MCSEGETTRQHLPITKVPSGKWQLMQHTLLGIKMWQLCPNAHDVACKTSAAQSPMAELRGAADVPSVDFGNQKTTTTTKKPRLCDQQSW